MGKWSDLDPKALLRFAARGPRYTSYPPATRFRPGFSEEMFFGLLGARGVSQPADGVGAGSLAGAAQGRIDGHGQCPTPGFSLYLHIPYCRGRCAYCGCNSIPCTDERNDLATYVHPLAEELRLVLGRLAGPRLVRQIHLGGGTPNLLTEEQVDRLLGIIAGQAAIDPGAEVSIELDPRTVRAGFLSFLRGRGFNRASFGLQDLDPVVQAASGRVQPAAMVEGLLEEARQVGFAGLNVDLIYGLPRQSRESFARTVEQVVGMEPDRVALFNFAYLPELKPNQRAIRPEWLPPPAEKLAIFLDAADRFEAHGYRFIGLDHFARPGDELAAAAGNGTLHRNFQGYTALGDLEVLAFGVTGISQLANGYAQNTREIEAYRVAVGEGRVPVERGLALSEEDRVRRFVIDSLMCNLAVDRGEVERRFNLDFEVRLAGYRERLRPLMTEGWVVEQGPVLQVVGPGRLLLRNIAMAFDALPPDPEGGSDVGSRTL